MPLWIPDRIEDEPEVILSPWAVMELPDSSRHFCGYNTLMREGRVSSRIEEFDRSSRIGRTRSGRLYSLEGKQGRHPDAEYVWSRWCRINGIDPAVARDVSMEICDA